MRAAHSLKHARWGKPVVLWLALWSWGVAFKVVAQTLEPSLRLAPMASPREGTSGSANVLRSGGFGLAFGAPFSG